MKKRERITKEVYRKGKGVAHRKISKKQVKPGMIVKMYEPDGPIVKGKDKNCTFFLVKTDVFKNDKGVDSFECDEFVYFKDAETARDKLMEKLTGRDKKGRLVKGTQVGKATRRKKGDPKVPGSGRRKKSPEELERLFKEYLTYASKKKKGLTVQGICRALGVSRQNFHKYYKTDPLYHDIIEKMYIEIEEWWTQYGLTGKATAFVIFYLKNFFGWKDDRSLRLGGLPDEDGNSTPIRIITTVADLKGAVSGRPDTK